MKNRHLLIIAGALALALALYFVTKGGDQKKSVSTQGTSIDSKASTRAGQGSKAKKEALASAQLSGRVIASDGTPLSKATVALVSSGDDEATLSADDAVVLTDVGGGYVYPALPPGEYTISASAPGFLPKQNAVRLRPGQERRELNLQLEPGGFSLRGTVHDATGGTVPGAVVQAMPLGGDTSSGALTGAEGNYEMGLANGHYMVWAYHADYVPHSQIVKISGVTQALDFSLAPGAVVEGQVKHLGSNAPVPGATVSYATERSNTLRLWQGSAGSGEVRADENGRFRISGLNSGSLRLGAFGEDATTIEPTRIALGIAEHRSGIELFLDPAFRVSGRIVDAATKDGIGAMKVSLMTPGDDGNSDGAVTADDGTFVIRSVPTGDHRLRAEGQDYLVDMFGTAVAVDGDTDAGDIEVSKGATIRGRVEPAAEADISIDLQSLRDMSIGAFTKVRSEADGSFEIGPFTPVAFRLEAETTDGRIGSAEVDVPAGGLSDVVIAISPGASLEGSVLDAEGKPVAGARVSLRQDTKERSLRVMVDGLDLTSQSGISSPDGTFLIQGLSGGNYQVQVLDKQSQPLAWADSEKSTSRQLSIGPKEKRSGEVLKVEARNASIEGRVLGPGGRPAADTWVSASLHRMETMQGPMPPPRPETSSNEDGEPTEIRSEVSMVMIRDSGGDGSQVPGLDLSRTGEVPPVLTDSDGKFEITGLRNGEYDLIAEGMKGEARAIVERAQTGQEIEIRMAALTRIEGTVTQGGAPVSRYSVELRGAGFTRKQVRDDEGRFAIHRLDPGKYTVTVRSSEGEASTEVTVVEGKTAEVAIVLEELIRVTGTVVDEAGNALPDLLTIPSPKSDDGNVQLTIDGDVSPTAADGTFEIRVAPGPYLLMVIKMGSGPTAMVPFEAKAGTTVDLGTIVAVPGQGMPGPGGPPGEEQE
ncbi:MAG: carboxypeptidase regulatory-like domain-containing protein [Myxococcales bacterium]|nr:carboxypeptidase regulatory-like domain-containing protein [Myxococcales bacterium]